MIANRILVELLEFLRRHEFLYGRLNVEFFSARMYEQIDKQECPASLRQFFTDAQRLSLLNKYCTKFLPISTSKTTQREEQICTKMRRVNPKKMHELSALNELCLAECERMGVDRIVDIGSGLGHFGRFLKHNNGSQQIEYVGIEADPVLCHSGRKICEDIQLENIFFGQPETAERCRHILSNGARTGIISLHGCGHLQRLIMKEFVELAKANPEKNPLLLTIGCCYHKVANWDDRTVERWMMSQSMLAAFKQVYGTSGFPIPGLRLAAQAKMSRWLDLSEKKRREHRRSFSNRAFVECVRTEIFGESNGRPRSLNRKLGDCPDEFREEVLRRSECPPEKRQHYEQLLDNAMREHSHAMAYIEPFAALQFALQAPLEALVQLDKLLYLREQGFDAEMVELFDPDISPRNMCIVARIKDS